MPSICSQSSVDEDYGYASNPFIFEKPLHLCVCVCVSVGFIEFHVISASSVQTCISISSFRCSERTWIYYPLIVCAEFMQFPGIRITAALHRYSASPPSPLGQISRQQSWNCCTTDCVRDLCASARARAMFTHSTAGASGLSGFSVRPALLLITVGAFRLILLKTASRNILCVIYQK